MDNHIHSEFMNGDIRVKVEEFSSMEQFYNYICETPFNDVFKYQSHSSTKTSDNKWSGTGSFEEATTLFKNGWDSMAQNLQQKLKIAEAHYENKTAIRAKYDVVGFQASVPRYLQGIPTSMINQKKVPQKQKVVTLNKDVSYSSMFSSEEIIENSIKAFQIVKRVEAQGIRCNLNLVFAETYNNEHVICKIRLKNSSERLNISKMAFPLVHTSMLRRLLFRFEEVCPSFTEKGFAGTYGLPLTNHNPGVVKLREYLKDEILLTRTIGDAEKEANQILNHK